MRSTAVGGIVLLAVVLAGAGCSQSAVSPAAASSTPEPTTSEAASPDSSASPSEVASAGPASGVKITFENVKSKRWGAKPFKVEAEAANGAKLKYSANGSCTVRSVSGLVEIEEAGDCVITATTAEGEAGMASTTIRVRPAKPKIQFAGGSVRFQRPFSYSLNAKVSPKIPLTFTLVNAGSDPDCKVDKGKLTLTQRKPSLELDCVVQVSAAKTSPNYETPKPVVAKVHVRYPSWNVDAKSPKAIHYEADGDTVRVTVLEDSGDALGIAVSGDGACTVDEVSPSKAPPGTTKYVVTLRVTKPADNGTPEGYHCDMSAHALPPDWTCCVGGTKSDEFTVTVLP